MVLISSLHYYFGLSLLLLSEPNLEFPDCLFFLPSSIGSLKIKFLITKRKDKIKFSMGKFPRVKDSRVYPSKRKTIDSQLFMKMKSDWHVAWIIWTTTSFGQKSLSLNYHRINVFDFLSDFKVINYCIPQIIHTW